MAGEVFAKQSDFAAHLAVDWRKAHNIWSNIKSVSPRWVRAIRTVSYTADAAWHDDTITGAPTGADKIIIAVFVVYVSTAQTTELYTVLTRKKGSSEGYEGAIIGHQDAVGQIIQECDENAQYQYNISATFGTRSGVLKQLGYWVFPA